MGFQARGSSLVQETASFLSSLLPDWWPEQPAAAPKGLTADFSTC